MENTKANKAFILEMIGKKKKLEDYPDKASDSMVVYEPSSLPFGGIYKGIDAYEKFILKCENSMIFQDSSSLMYMLNQMLYLQ